MQTAAQQPAPGRAPRACVPPRVVIPGVARGGWSRAGGVVVCPVLGTLRVGSDGSCRWLPGGEGAVASPVASSSAPLAALAGAIGAGAGGLAGEGWAGYLSYDLGRVIEARAQHAPRAGPLPLVELHRIGGGSAWSPRRGDPATAGGLVSETGRAGYVAAVERTLGYIRAGDIYQANIAHRLCGAFSGCGVGLFDELAGSARPRHGAYIETAALADGSRAAIASLSPELFLSFDAAPRRLVTRPMKGTRPGRADPAELLTSEKERAELAMIVDLMRNDLGRVCEFGSVRVESPREIERHGSGLGEVLQATATVSGVVREGLGIAEILAATFPPGSVTGTPKIRAMQIIDELEPFARGPYCGCIGTFADDGSFELAVAIRTAVIHGASDPRTGDFVGAELTYCVGAGIVADSDPVAEWEETLAKARVLEPVFEIGA